MATNLATPWEQEPDATRKIIANSRYTKMLPLPEARFELAHPIRALAPQASPSSYKDYLLVFTFIYLFLYISNN
ncbi:MAG: hypothetical protein ACXAC2_25695 [Candidatus Kariarchaeaceae archaeon]